MAPGTAETGSDKLMRLGKSLGDLSKIFCVLWFFAIVEVFNPTTSGIPSTAILVIAVAPMVLLGFLSR